MCYFITVTTHTPRGLKTPATWLLVQQLIQTITTNEPRKFRIAGPLWVKFIGFPSQRVCESEIVSMPWRHHIFQPVRCPNPCQATTYQNDHPQLPPQSFAVQHHTETDDVSQQPEVTSLHYGVPERPPSYSSLFPDVWFYSKKNTSIRESVRGDRMLMY